MRINKVIKFAFLVLGLVCVTIALSFELTFSNNQITRDVVYDKIVIDESVFDEFDSYSIEQTNEIFNVHATKEFDISIFDEFDLVSFDESQESVSVFYQVLYIYEEDTIFLNVSMGEGDEYQLIDSIPGLVSINNEGDADILFAVDGDLFWLSELTNDSVINQTGWFKNLIKTITNTAVTVASAVVEAVAVIVYPIVQVSTLIAVTLLGPELAAGIGAYLLNMEMDENNIYHADFECWQQYFGYTDLYDVVFNASTSMRENKIGIDIDGDDYYEYMLWSWKGNYLNLGAGAELGVYERWTYSDEIWKVNKDLAMDMTIKLEHKNVELFTWSANHWWITGFDYKTTNVNRDDLTATFTFTPTNSTIKNKLKVLYYTESTLSYSTTSDLFTIQF